MDQMRKNSENTKKPEGKKIMSHAERYQYLVDHQVGGKVTNYYRSAFYILSATKELFEKSKPYTTEGIDFSPIKNRVSYEKRELFPLVDIAENLFTGSEDCRITAFLLSQLPVSHLELVVTALHISGGNYEVETKGTKFILDALPALNKKATEKTKIY